MGIIINNQMLPSTDNQTLSISSTVKSTLSKVCESLCQEYKLSSQDQDELKSIVQDEAAYVITQFISSKSLDNKTNINDQSSDDIPKFIMSIPINDLWELSTIANRNKGNAVEIYIKCDQVSNSVMRLVNIHQDDDGNNFIDTVTIPNKESYVKVGTITRDEANQWMLRIDKSFPANYVDITMYTRCWLCHNNKVIRDFLNDIYARINHKGEYRLMKESVDNQSTDDLSTYELEYNPDDIIVYIKDNIDPNLDEELVSYHPEVIIQDFLESLPGIDTCVVDEKFSPGKAFLVGYGVPKAVGLIKRIIPSAKSTYVDHSNDLIAMNKANYNLAISKNK